MEQPSRNLEFMKTQFFEFYRTVNFSEQFLDHLCGDENNPFRDLMKDLKAKIDANVLDRNEAKMFVLMQYLKSGRHPADYFVRILEQFGMIELVEKLKQFNRSEKFVVYEDYSALTVRQTNQSNSNYTMCYPMDAHPRGILIIILNEKKLETEALAFQYVFEQLYFKVEIRRNQTAQQIKNLFSYVSGNPEYNEMNTLMTVCIGHGGDECFLGVGYGPTNDQDQIPIIDLVDQFNEQNCVAFKDKPKFHIFICCRNRTASVDDNIETLRNYDLARIFNQNWRNTNVHTTVIYSCAEGLTDPYNEWTGYSPFGRAFLHTIAQFACDYSLEDLLKRVNQRLEEESWGDQRPQSVNHLCTRNTYFNPGL